MTDVDDTNSISTRPVTAADRELLVRIYERSRGDDLRELGWAANRISEFLAMQYEAQETFYAAEYKQANDMVVLWESQPVGRLIVERREHELRCIDVALLPEHRNHRIGSWLIRQLQDEAKREKKPLRLQVIRFNRAVTLFERMGFVQTSETGTHFQLEWNSDQ